MTRSVANSPRAALLQCDVRKYNTNSRTRIRRVSGSSPGATEESSCREGEYTLNLLSSNYLRWRGVLVYRGVCQLRCRRL
ncbi:hypothetical protein TNCV_870701 [Trichonephila clavipes]|nr:hypothetical protein TNCV_870701 [Trichonephila clavipes]